MTSVLAKTIGRVNLDAPATGLTAVAYWARFSHWCRTHPAPGADGGEDGRDRTWLYQSVIEQEGLDHRPIATSSSVYTEGLCTPLVRGDLEP